MDQKTKRVILSAQRNEITEHFLYRKIAQTVSDEQTKKTIEKIADQEKAHYERWRALTKTHLQPSHWKILFYYMVTRLFGLSFGLRLMERGEKLAIQLYNDLPNSPIAHELVRQEQQHEEQLLELIDDQRLHYISSFVLGLNDALVELTGVLAGLTLALAETRLIAMVGVITGIAASFSMGASQYLAIQEEDQKRALSAGIVTGVAYVVTVLILVLPYLFVTNAFAALTTTIAIAVMIIALFNFYTSVAKKLPFFQRFSKMATISLGIAALNFGIGFLVKRLFGIE